MTRNTTQPHLTKFEPVYNPRFVSVQCQRLFRPARHTLSLAVYNFSIFPNKYLDHCMRNGLLQPPGNPLPPPPPFAPDAVPMNRFTRSVRGVIIGSRNNICIPSEETNACPLHLRVDYMFRVVFASLPCDSESFYSARSDFAHIVKGLELVYCRQENKRTRRP
jgi:hypothetical protein